MDYNYLSKITSKKRKLQFKEVYNQAEALINCWSERKMCEFNVILNGKTVFKDVIYAKAESNSIIVKNVLGESKELKNCKIVEVDVNSTRLILKSLNP